MKRNWKLRAAAFAVAVAYTIAANTLLRAVFDGSWVNGVAIFNGFLAGVGSQAWASWREMKAAEAAASAAFIERLDQLEATYAVMWAGLHARSEDGAS